jgi:hypothetical protein
MKKVIFIVFLSIFISNHLLFAQHQDKKKKESPEVSILIETETAYDFDDRKLQKSELFIEPQLNWKLNKNIKLTGIGRLYVEVTDNLEPGENNMHEVAKMSKRIEFGDRADVVLRELYADIKWGKSYWRIGKQQIVLGETEGIKVLDVVNPMNWREFILDDFDDSRIPLWSVKGDIKLGKLKLQTFWVPDLTYHDFSTGMFSPYIPMPEFPQGLNVVFKETDKPNNPLKDADFGGSLSTFLKGWDLSFTYFHHYDDFPVFNQGFSLDVSGNPVLLITPTYKRVNLTGISFSNVFGNFGIRGEFGYTPDKRLNYINPQDPDGIVKAGQLNSGLGLDYYGLSETIVTLQWFGDIINSDKIDGTMLRDDLVHYSSLMLSRTFLNQRLEGRSFLVYGPDSEDGFVSIKFSYLWKDNLKVWLGSDIFFGDTASLVGFYNRRDRVMFGIEWGLQFNKNEK